MRNFALVAKSLHKTDEDEGSSDIPLKFNDGKDDPKDCDNRDVMSGQCLPSFNGDLQNSSCVGDGNKHLLIEKDVSDYGNDNGSSTIACNTNCTKELVISHGIENVCVAKGVGFIPSEGEGTWLTTALGGGEFVTPFDSLGVQAGFDMEDGTALTPSSTLSSNVSVTIPLNID